MSDVNWTKFWDDLKKIYEDEDKNLDSFTAERPVLELALKAIAQDLDRSYSIVEPLGRGGAGVVIRVTDKHLQIERALKLPRPRQEDLIDTVRNEAEHLKKLRHDHIIRVYHLSAVPIAGYTLPYPYFVMDFVEGVRNLRKSIDVALASADKADALSEITSWLAKKLLSIAEALTYLHLHETIHFDVKPANILIDPEEKPILSDLGFAKRKLVGGEDVVVGFTLFYAHPDLRSEYQKMSSQDRVRKKLNPSQFNFSWDIYAFGKTILEMLSAIDSHFPDAVPYDYAFVYLHLMACRMLDGRSQSDTDTDRARLMQAQKKEAVSTYRETWLNFEPRDFTAIKYASFSQVLADLEELVHNRQCGEKVAELNSFFVDRVQIAAGSPAVFSGRVKALVEHPCFARLGSVLQLGILNTVYPGVTHTRLEHSLGAFKHCRSYLQALYHDPYNPLFRQLITDEDLRAVMVASLVHDLGQFPLAHELEEIDKSLKHEKLTIAWLDNPTRDKAGHTIRDVIEDKKWGWGVPIDRVKEILMARKRKEELFGSADLKDSMLGSIIDGPLDVDKLDYLIRDSRNAGLTYGELIDVDRLLRSLTVVIHRDKAGQCVLTIGTYEKGQSAAESLSFARYLLFQALYWHRIARSVRAMMKEAIRLIPPKGGGRTAVKDPKGTLSKALEELLGITSEPQILTANDVLNLLEKLTSEAGKKIIRNIKARDYYKRLATIYLDSEPEAGGKQPYLDRFREACGKAGFNDDVQERIRNLLDASLAQLEGPVASALAPDRRNLALELLKEPGKILCDCPKAPYGTNEKLLFIPEPRRLQHNYMTRVRVGERVSEMWEHVFFRLMNIAAKGRIFCDPRIRDTLMAAVGPDSIRDCVRKVVDGD
jgi:HD superfamily phosphohydrolase